MTQKIFLTSKKMNKFFFFFIKKNIYIYYIKRTLSPERIGFEIFQIGP